MRQTLHYFRPAGGWSRQSMLDRARHVLKEVASRSVRTGDAQLLASELRLLASEVEHLDRTIKL